MNLGMDARSLFSNGFHPVSASLTPDLGDSAHGIPRFASPEPLKYYFIDFGLSHRFSPKEPSPRLRVAMGGDKTVPEYKDPHAPLDPYKLDIYCLGNLFRGHFINASTALQSPHSSAYRLRVAAEDSLLQFHEASRE